MSRKSRTSRPARSAPAPSEATEPASQDHAQQDPAKPDAAPESMRDAMRAALDAKASRQSHTPGSGPRPGSDGAAGRGGGGKGFRALPRRSAG